MSTSRSSPQDIVRPVVTILMLLGSLGVLAAVVLGLASDVMKDTTASLTLGTVLGFWFNELKQVLGYWFGMTKHGQEQNNAITDLAVSPDRSSTPKKNN